MDKLDTGLHTWHGEQSLLGLGSLLVIALLVALSGCRDAILDREPLPDPTPTPAGELVEVSIPVDLSLFSTPVSTRALSAVAESTIDPARSRLFILDSSRKLLYEASIASITPSATDHQVGEIKARLRPTTTPVTAVLYGNLSQEMKQAEVTVGTAADDLAKRFTYARPTDLSKELLPLWGETKISSISAQGVTAETLYLLRSVARIDVGLRMTALTNSGAKDPDFSETSQKLKGRVAGEEVTFSLAKTYLYNVSATGLVAPKAGLYGTDHRVTGPSTPEGVGRVDKIDYSDKIADNLLRREIYVPETDNSSATLGVEKRPFLVVGLTYTGSTKPTYYRIDFMTKDKEGKYSYLSLLRNYRYKVSILEVNGPGYDTPEEAAKAPATRLRYEVMAFEESEMDHVAYDGPYRLSVDRDHISVGRYGSVATLHVGTNWPRGWSVEIPSKVTPTGSTAEVDNPLAKDQSWISFDDYTIGGPNKPADDTKGLKMTINPLATTSKQPRDGYLYIRAGRMRWLVHVAQSAEADLDIRIFSDEMGGVPLQFIELSQLGLKAGLTTSKGAKREIPGYRRFYVRTDPYFDPNTEEGKKFLPFWTDQRTSTFYFWDFAGSTTSPTDEQLMGSVRTDGTYPHEWTATEHRTGSPTLFRYTGHDNIWECIITAPPMTGNKDPKDTDFFERRDNTYRASIQDGVKKSTRAEAELRVLQMEYNVVPYFDEELTTQMIRPDSTGSYLMDGTTHQLYIDGNTECVLTFLSSESDMTSATDLILPIDDNRPLRADQLPFGWKFKTADDMPTDGKEPTRYHGYATWEIASQNELFDTYTVTVELMSGMIQPEANTYIVKADSKLGILIPVSQINKAADYYNWLLDYDKKFDPYAPGSTRVSEQDIQFKSFIGNTFNIELDRLDDDDHFVPWLIWTDLGPAKRDEQGRLDQSGAGVKRLSSLTREDSSGRKIRYIYFLPAPVKSRSMVKGGNVLIGARSGKIEGSPNLWSWHIWLVRSYPKMYHSRGTAGQQRIWMLDRNLGSDSKGTRDYNTETAAMGFAYQWGRKDPFPWTAQILSPRGNQPKKSFWDGEGNRFYFPDNQRGSRANRGEKAVAEGIGGTFTMKESVRNPNVVVSNQSVWMSEHLPFNNDPEKVLFPRATWHWIWETPFIDKDAETSEINLSVPLTPQVNTAEARLSKGEKSPFDPSPYGMRLPKYPELDIMRFIFYWETGTNSVWNTQLGTLYDGNYSNIQTTDENWNQIQIAGAAWTNPGQIRAVIPSRYAGSYLRNSVGSNAGWASGSTTEYTFRRANGFAVRPVADVPFEKKSDVTQKWIDEHITKYWPGYKK